MSSVKELWPVAVEYDPELVDRVEAHIFLRGQTPNVDNVRNAVYQLSEPQPCGGEDEEVTFDLFHYPLTNSLSSGPFRHGTNGGRRVVRKSMAEA